MEKRISIIIPFYNAEKSLQHCLNSIINQQYSNYELILINDGSTDSSLEIAKKYAKINKNIVVIDKENTGVSDSRNIGLEKSNGTLIYFMDSDDIISPNLLTIINNNFDENVDMLNFDYIKIKNYSFLFKQEDNYLISYETNDDCIYNILNENNGFIWNKVYRENIIKKNKLKFDVNLSICEDLLFNVQYLNLVKNTKKINYVGYGYYQSENSSYNKKNNLKWFTIIDAIDKVSDIVKTNFTSRKLNAIVLYILTYYKIEASARNSINDVKYEKIKLIKKNNFSLLVKTIFNINIDLKKKIKLLIFWILPKETMKYKKIKLKNEGNI